MKHNSPHKYIRKDISSSKIKSYFVYQCALIDCFHYIQQQNIFGKSSLCWNCSESFVIHQIGNRPYKRKPICDDCWKKLYKKEEKEVDDKTIEAILKEAGAI